MLIRCTFGLALILATSLVWPSVRAQTAVPAQAIDYARDIQPLFAQHCYECHGPDKARGRLRLDLRAAAFRGGLTGPALVPGNGEQSPLVRRLLGLDGEDQMPKDGDPLPAHEIALIRAWIDQGAVWPGEETASEAASAAANEPRHWAYRPLARPPVPEVRDTKWARTAVDRFVLARLEKEGLVPAHDAPLETLLRRASLDLTGLPPSPAEIDEVVGEATRNGRAAAYGRFVDRLLASPHYGERWARPWLDLARYADSNGFEKDQPRVMWKYRDWVIHALNKDMPFDQFTIEQIAGDMLPNATPDQIVASGFHRNAMTNEEGGIDPEEAHYEVMVDRVNTTASVWLGTTLACAQCHNHKYDPFSQKDYYRMMAFFTNTTYEVRALGDGTKFFETMMDVPTPEQETKRKTLQAEIDRLNEKLRTPTPALARAQRLWEQSMAAEPTLRWKVLTPKSATATGDVVLTTARDGSLIASGPNAAETTYTIEAVTTVPRVTAIRLEALPDPSLPKGGPGRDVYGNFQVNGISIEARPLPAAAPATSPASPRVRRRGSVNPGASLGPRARAASSSYGSAQASLALKAIKADDSAGGASIDTFFPKSLPRDAYAPRGWRIDASRDLIRLPRQIVFTLAAPLTGAATLRVQLTHYGAAKGQSIGRFRLSATSSATPQRIVDLPARLRPLLGKADEDRTEQQNKDVATFYRTVAPSLKADRDRLAARQKDLRALAIPSALVMRERVSYERPSAHVRRRGAFMDKGELVYAGVPDVLHSLREDQMPNRLGLARWLVDDRNPLTPRVVVNRAWEQFFGRGLVETSEDFGAQGAAPSHPDLLDWLASELVAKGWRMKALHKLIVTSAVYRQASAVTPASLERDPYNRLLARGSRFRLEAEMVRDIALAASGLLSRKVGGPSVFPPQPDGIWDIPYSNERWVTSEGADRYRRGVYTFIRRSAAYPSFMTFDATSRESCTVRRVRTNTPLQALVTLNDEAFFEAAQALAARVLREASPSVRPVTDGVNPNNELGLQSRFTLLSRLVLSRTPNASELGRIVGSFTMHFERFRKDPAAATRVIKGYAIEGVDAAEQAAWTLVANALLNLDEALTRE
jgi:mono/diheme cytochrome c family protein